MVNTQSVTMYKNGPILVPEDSVMPDVRVIKIMTGRKAFFGKGVFDGVVCP